jgi:hypothetical protein
MVGLMALLLLADDEADARIMFELVLNESDLFGPRVSARTLFFNTRGEGISSAICSW